MAGIKSNISDDVKAAMRSKNKTLLGALRLIQAAFKQKEVDERIELNDEQVIVILDKMAKQHRDSISQFKAAKRDDLVKIEEFELDIIDTYLPTKLSDEEINILIEEAISKSSAESIKDMGKVMGILKKELQGRADMGKVSELIKSKLNF
ncbi:GatB/YqeY domain-containing protein [bacterium]|jgi:uncharacterized protein|nr:GatB/YqeY domain-containing protein [bacterium]